MRSVRESTAPEAARGEPAKTKPKGKGKAAAPKPQARAARRARAAQAPVDAAASAPAAAGSDSDAWGYERAHAGSSSDLSPIVGANLRRLRTRRGLSLEKLSKASGVSRAMLGQIELGQSAPSINVLWKIARSLDVTFSALISASTPSGATILREQAGKRLTSHDGAFTSRALFPFDAPRRVEFYELRLAARRDEHADAHPPGTSENLIVTHGTLELTVGHQVHRLGTGDAILFDADVPHIYANPGDVEAVMYLVMTYAQDGGGAGR